MIGAIGVAGGSIEVQNARSGIANLTIDVTIVACTTMEDLTVQRGNQRIVTTMNPIVGKGETTHDRNHQNIKGTKETNENCSHLH